MPTVGPYISETQSHSPKLCTEIQKWVIVVLFLFWYWVIWLCGRKELGSRMPSWAKYKLNYSLAKSKYLSYKFWNISQVYIGEKLMKNPTSRSISQSCDSICLRPKVNQQYQSTSVLKKWSWMRHKNSIEFSLFCLCETV